MRADLEGALEGIKEKVAQQETRRLATLEHEEQARLEREKGGGGEAEGQRPDQGVRSWQVCEHDREQGKGA
jgi:hypothetical protein